jgi:hypothetical protein
MQRALGKFKVRISTGLWSGRSGDLRWIIAVVVILAALWPFYRKFFVNEWRERIAGGLPVVFIPDCPTTFSQFKCGDRYTVAFRKLENNQLCSRVRKNEDAEGPETCGLDIDAWDFARSWRYLTVEGVRIYYSWRGRVIGPPGKLAGWLVTPETIAARRAHPLAMK